MSESRYVIGIDLGTTTCSLAYWDSLQPDQGIRMADIGQWDGAERWLEHPVLPSFFYCAPKNQAKKGRLNTPWHQGEEPADHAVGRWARTLADKEPDRTIRSAKSWLCHAGVDRREKLLPWHSDTVVGRQRLSPVEVTAAYLRHLRGYWDHTFGAHDESYRLAHQAVVITVPASFDEVACELTLEAAHAAGYPAASLQLLEEPKAAFFTWVSGASGTADPNPARLLEAVGEKESEATVLVCDIGGGTCDFSLFRAEKKRWDRIAVSDHILLGGDNIDLALATEVEEKLGRKLRGGEWAECIALARQLKEKALDRDVAGDSELSVTLAARGSSLLGGSQSVTFTADEVRQKVSRGFFAPCAADDPGAQQRSALSQWGLPYAQETRFTAHLAAFLGGRSVDGILFTGGTMVPALVRGWMMEAISAWQETAPVELDNPSYELAVARGAATFGWSHRRGLGWVGGGYPRTLYAEVQVGPQERQLLTLIGRGGEDAGKPRRLTVPGLKVLVGTQVQFFLYSSRQRRDTPGTLLPARDETIIPLAPLQTTLDGPAGTSVAVDLEVRLASSGALALAVVGEGEGQRWQLSFDLKAQHHRPDGEGKGPAYEPPQLPLEKLELAVGAFYGKGKKKPAASGGVGALWSTLEGLLAGPRSEWTRPALRSLVPSLVAGMNRRQRSPAHEVTWLSLTGFALRPGFGDPSDERHIEALWPLFAAGLHHRTSGKARVQWWIFWRRISAGLSPAAQETLLNKLYPTVRSGEVEPEAVLLLGSLEKVPMDRKMQLGDQFITSLGKGTAPRLWALARLASRVPLGEGHAQIVRPGAVEGWYRKLEGRTSKELLPFMAFAGRITGEREWDLAPEFRETFLKRLAEAGAADELMAPLREHVPVAREWRQQLFGEDLPLGLMVD